MKITLCDVCYNSKEREKVDATHRLSYKDNRNGMRVAIDTCHKHQNYLKNCGSFERARQVVDELFLGNLQESK